MNTPVGVPSTTGARIWEGVPSPKHHCPSDVVETDKNQPITSLLPYTGYPAGKKEAISAIHTTDTTNKEEIPGTPCLDENEEAAIDNVMSLCLEQLAEMLPQNIIQEYFT